MEAIISSIPALPSLDVPEVAAGAVATAAAEPPAIGRGQWDMRARTVRWMLESAKRMGATTVATNSSGLSSTMSAVPARGALNGDRCLSSQCGARMASVYSTAPEAQKRLR